MLLLLHIVYTAIKITYEVFRICFSSKGFSTKIRIEYSAGGSCYGLLINSTLPPMPQPLPDGSDPETATVSRPQEFGSQPTTTNSTTIVTAAAHLHPHPRGHWLPLRDGCRAGRHRSGMWRTGAAAQGAAWRGTRSNATAAHIDTNGLDETALKRCAAHLPHAYRTPAAS